MVVSITEERLIGEHVESFNISHRTSALSDSTGLAAGIGVEYGLDILFAQSRPGLYPIPYFQVGPEARVGGLYLEANAGLSAVPLSGRPGSGVIDLLPFLHGALSYHIQMTPGIGYDLEIGGCYSMLNGLYMAVNFYL